MRPNFTFNAQNRSSWSTLDGIWFSEGPEVYPTPTDPIGCFMLTVLPYKYELGHIDLIPMIHHIHLKKPWKPEFSNVSPTPPHKKACPHASGHSI